MRLIGVTKKENLLDYFAGSNESCYIFISLHLNSGSN